VLHAVTRIALALLLAACSQTTAPNRTAVFEANADQVTVGMRMKMTEEGTTKADLHADTAVTPPGSNRTDLTGVRLTFSTPSGKDGKLTSKKGEYDPTSQVMVARGNVVLIVPGEAGKGSRTITSEELHWDQRGDRVWSDRKTTMVEDGRTLHTDGFTSDTRFHNISGKNASTGSVRVGDGGIRF
jgi:LPS export ABC transporter protein LptC